MRFDGSELERVNIDRLRASRVDLRGATALSFDGVGRLEDGSRVYFLMPQAPYGSMAQYAVAPAARRLAVPDDLGRVVDERWDPPVTLGVRLVSIVNDDQQHVGQAAFVRGLLDDLRGARG